MFGKEIFWKKNGKNYSFEADLLALNVKVGNIFFVSNFRRKPFESSTANKRLKWSVSFFDWEKV